MLSFFPRGVLDEILNLIGSVSEEFPSYSFSLIAKWLEREKFSVFFQTFPIGSDRTKMIVKDESYIPQ